MECIGWRISELRNCTTKIGAMCIAQSSKRILTGPVYAECFMEYRIQLILSSGIEDAKFLEFYTVTCFAPFFEDVFFVVLNNHWLAGWDNNL
jgi:hypothetical protein